MRDSDLAYLKLKNMIIKTDLKPGEILKESDLIETLNFGRTPIREALNRLSWDRLVVIIPRKGIMVSQINIDDLQSIFELRSIFEELIGRLVPKKITNEDIENLKEILTIQPDEYDSKFDKNVDMDREFHTALVKITNNRFLEEDYLRIYNASLRLLYLNKAKMQDLIGIANECNEIISNIKENNGNGLSKMLKSHLLDFKKKVLSNY